MQNDVTFTTRSTGLRSERKPIKAVKILGFSLTPNEIEKIKSLFFHYRLGLDKY